MFMLFIESLFYKIVETMFSNLRNSFSLISPKIHKEFVHETPLNMTHLLVPKSLCMFEKNWGDEGSEEAPPNLL